MNWPGFAFLEIPVTLNITVQQLKGRIRLLYSEQAQSHLQFMWRPSATVNIEPVIGEEQTINLQSLPKVTQMLKEIVDKVITDLVYPNKLPMPIPCVNESFKLDREGRIIIQ